MHLIKYRLLQTLREPVTLFWALAFPFILGTLFYVSFWSLGESDSSPWDPVPVAVVEGTGNQAFSDFLTSADGSLIDVEKMASKELALAAMQDGRVTGVFEISDPPLLHLSGTGSRESMLKTMLDSYLRNAAIIERVAREHPENLQAALAALQEEVSVTETDLGGNTTNSNIPYFLALIGYACLNGVYMGRACAMQSRADASPLGIRRSVSPTGKLAIVLTDMGVMSAVHFADIALLVVYLRLVLGIPVALTPALFLTVLLGCMLGISLGILIGCAPIPSDGLKSAMCIGVTLLCGFLAGLMYGNMKNIVEQKAPLVNRINPAAVLSDAFYCLSVYDNPLRLQRDLIILLCMSAVCLTLAFLSLRRERYASL